MLLAVLRVFTWSAVLSLSLAGTVLAQPVFQVKDINTDRPYGTFPMPKAEFAEFVTQIVFTASDSIHGTELWVTDGTEVGTRILKDICPGACSSLPSDLTTVGSQVLFVADDGAHGRELWSTNLAGAGVQMVADLTPGLPSTQISSLIEHQGALLFAAQDPVHGAELWKSNGTAAGTALLADIQPGPGSSKPTFWTAMGTSLFLLADDGSHGRELWKTDGTAAGTALVKDTLPGSDSGFAETYSVSPYSPIAYPFAFFSGKLFFLGDGGLWATDGTEGGTLRVATVFPNLGSSIPFSLCATQEKIFFYSGGSLWTSDGTEAGTAIVHYFGIGGPFHLTALGDEAFFVAFQPPLGFDPYDRFELWKTDGTPEGTVVVRNIGPGDQGGLDPDSPLTVFGGKLLFWADDGVHGFEPWTSDGTKAGTSLLADLSPLAGTGARPRTIDDLLIAGNQLYFRLAENNLVAMNLFTTDGTPAGTRKLRRIAMQASALQPGHEGFLPGPRPMADLNGTLIFQAENRTGNRLWRTDGTAASTSSIGVVFELPRELTPLGNALVFAGSLAGDAWVWTTDGTLTGTVNLSPGPIFGPVIPPSWLTPLGDFVFFYGRTRGGLWKTDGTLSGDTYLGGAHPEALTPLGSSLLFRDFFSTQQDEGTVLYGTELMKSDGVSEPVLVKDILPGEGSSRPSQLIAAGGFVFFSADDGAAGRELWKTDGTEEGTVLVKDIRSGSGIRNSYDGRDFPEELWAAVGSTVFFPADDGAAGEELWKSDGTEAGTVLVKDIFPGSRSSDIRWLTTVGNRIYFVAEDGVHGRELWVSDGTGPGTRMVMDIASGPDSSRPQELTAMGDVLLFSATDGEGWHGLEPWRTTGSTLGTRRIQDIAPGSLSSSPMGFTSSGPNVYFAANDSFAGFELWAVPKLSLLSSFGDVSSDYWAWNFIEALASAGITTGCAPGLYCPLSPVSRAEMAVFLERGIRGGGFVPPPASGTVFTDVLFDHWAAAWIEQLAADGITTGCAPSQYCPEAPVNRAEMAVFLLRARHGAAYTPPSATGTRFTDVPASFWAAAWIEQLAAEGITTGCAPDQYCPGSSVSRDQMAAFLARTFALPLP